MPTFSILYPVLGIKKSFDLNLLLKIAKLIKDNKWSNIVIFTTVKTILKANMFNIFLLLCL